MMMKCLQAHREVPHPHHGEHEPHHDRRHRHVRRLPPDCGRQTKFACVDGPDFDGFEVDFDEAMHRGTMYRDFEAHAREAECNLLKKEVE